MKTTKNVYKLQITVTRPGGITEKVFHPSLTRINDAQFEQMKKATKAAGRGDLKSYETISVKEDLSLKEQREYLVDDIAALVYEQRAARQRDYDNDIGFHESPKFDEKINALRTELRDFDKANPEIFAEIKKAEDEKTARQIQSALNA